MVAWSEEDTARIRRAADRGARTPRVPAQSAAPETESFRTEVRRFKPGATDEEIAREVRMVAVIAAGETAPMVFAGQELTTQKILGLARELEDWIYTG